MKIYTKTGDAGETGLFGGARIAKHSLRIAAIGEVDELNACLGLARQHSGETELDESLGHIQAWLFDLGGELACPPGGKFDLHGIHSRQIDYLETSIDRMTVALPELRNFILPGGSPLAAHLHLARGVCRRAERAMLALDESEPLRSDVKVFVNRLSDWLFTAARTANRLADVQDIAWTRYEKQ